MAYTVITIPGAFSSYNTGNFGGLPFTAPNVRIPGPGGNESNWNSNTLSDSAITTDMNNMYDLIIANLNAQADGVLVFGHSRGAQCIYKLIRQRKADLIANVPTPSKLRFVSSGNPERKFNGACVVHYSGHTPAYPGTQPYLNGYGLPDPSPFVFLDISRQLDEWADHPQGDDSTSQRAITTAAGVHSAYSGAAALGADGYPVNWDDWTTWDHNNVTYLVSPYFPGASTPAQGAYTSQARVHKILQRRQDEAYGQLDAALRKADEDVFARPKIIAPPRPYRWTGAL